METSQFTVNEWLDLIGVLARDIVRSKMAIKRLDESEPVLSELRKLSREEYQRDLELAERLLAKVKELPLAEG